MGTLPTPPPPPPPPPPGTPAGGDLLLHSALSAGVSHSQSSACWRCASDSAAISAAGTTTGFVSRYEEGTAGALRARRGGGYCICVLGLCFRFNGDQRGGNDDRGFVSRCEEGTAGVLQGEEVRRLQLHQYLEDQMRRRNCTRTKNHLNRRH